MLVLFICVEVRAYLFRPIRRRRRLVHDPLEESL